MLPFPEGELGLPVAEPFPFPGKKAPPSEEDKTIFRLYQQVKEKSVKIS